MAALGLGGTELAAARNAGRTLVSLVPLGVIALGILSAFPNFATLRQALLAFIFRNFVPQISEQAAWWFEYFAASATQATAIGIVGIAATGILLLVTVEDQLNLLWRVPVPRPWSQRVVAYWTLMTLGPLLVGMSLTLSTYLDTAARRDILMVAGSTGLAPLKALAAEKALFGSSRLQRWFGQPLRLLGQVERG